MRTFSTIFPITVACMMLVTCAQRTNEQPAAIDEEASTAGQSAVSDSESQKNVVQVAMGSPDHTTLVQAIKAADLVDALSNAGPFTVFAPVNEAFDKLPAGTVENLLDPEQKEQLQDILQYHVAVGVYKLQYLRDGQNLGMVNGSNVKVKVTGDKVSINGATVLASVPAANGIVHIIDGVLTPERAN